MAEGRGALDSSKLDAHLQPPTHLRDLFKSCRKADLRSSEDRQPLDIVDTKYLHEDDRAYEVGLSHQDRCRVTDTCHEFMQSQEHGQYIQPQEARMFELNGLPGLIIAPQIFSSSIQCEMLNQLFHEELSKKQHNTNLTMFYDVSYPPYAQSFFHLDQHSTHEPLDPCMHKPISTTQMLEKHLRWVTLGGQYDWTNKQYPQEKAPQFPTRLKRLIKGIFPQIEPQAAILNLYSPGDTLSLHRDVSEECDRPLVSISIGCDALFLVANLDGSKYQIVRLHSGDAVLMGGQSRYAWHAIPKVLAGTCPDDLQDWPAASNSSYAHWKGWLAGKRINLNVRQMKLEHT